ncbi:MAG: DUF192 domain-containing protein [Bdellovibrionales bacterium]|nr:DUF192 domain-containing protein [Bdellovibrionales bacterium]
MTLNLIRKHDGAQIASRAEVASSFAMRLRGLIGRTRFEAGEGLLFPRCNSVHMWMMSIPIDLVFLKKQSSEWMVLSIHRELRPWKLLPVGDFRADDALELPAGTIERSGLKSGEVLCIAS